MQKASVDSYARDEFVYKIRCHNFILVFKTIILKGISFVYFFYIQGYSRYTARNIAAKIRGFQKVSSLFVL